MPLARFGPLAWSTVEALAFRPATNCVPPYEGFSPGDRFKSKIK